MKRVFSSNCILHSFPIKILNAKYWENIIAAAAILRKVTLTSTHAFSRVD